MRTVRSTGRISGGGVPGLGGVPGPGVVPGLAGYTTSRGDVPGGGGVPGLGEGVYLVGGCI